MPRGGKRSGAGRPKGALSSKTVEQLRAVEAGGLTPLEYMLQVMRDESNETSERMDAAHKAAPYVHARLAAVDHSSSDGSMSPVAGLDIRIVDAPEDGVDEAAG